VPEYRVIAHRRVHKFISKLKDEKLKTAVKTALKKLQNYPISLKEMDVEKIKGLERTFRIRIGDYRIIFHVGKMERTIYVAHIEARKKVYERLGRM